jgi:cytochrome c2
MKCARLFAACALFLCGATATGQEYAPGLVGWVIDSTAHMVIDVAPTPNLVLAPGESIHPQISPSFTVFWSGFIEIRFPGRYRFSFDGDSVQFKVNNSDVAGKWVELEAGRHSIDIFYNRPEGAARVRMLWEGEAFGLEPVPSDRLTHNAARPDLGGHYLIEEGRALALSLGCINCHSAASSSATGRMGPRLTSVGARTSAAWLHGWLADPQAFRSGAVMPSMLTDGEREDVVAYLASLEGESFAPLEKEWGVHEVSKGQQHYFAFGCAACHEQEGLGLAGMGSKMDGPALAAYLQDPTSFDSSGVMPSMNLSRSEAEEIAAYLLQSRHEDFETVAITGDAAQGKHVVQQRGCIACHDLVDGAPLANGLSAPSLTELDGGRGCLADTPPAGVPRYRFQKTQREALAAYVESQRVRADYYAAPIHAFRQSVDNLRCAACHQMENDGPVVQLTERAPLLTDAGSRLQPVWTAAVLAGEKRIRPWLRLRMPVYEADLVAALPAALTKASGLPADHEDAAISASKRRVNRGMDLIGSDAEAGGLACINCHEWGGHTSLGENGPQLKDVAQRVRYEWFHRWLSRPSRIQSGTSMPTFFEHLGPRRANRQIESLWAALSLGDDMPLPSGLGKVAAIAGSEEIPIPGKEAIIIRWFMPEASPAAIAVGMPGAVSYCFDAAVSRIRYAWIGGFVNMAPALAKPAPPAEVLGDIFYRSAGHPIRLENIEEAPATRFKGYRIIDGFPQFHYQLNGVDIYERVVPAAQGDGITREFTLSTVESAAWFLADMETGVTFSSTLGDFEDGKLKLPPGKNVRIDVTVTLDKDAFFEF